ncbi:hypothetical protein GCM10027038_20650 [Arthrobacter bambusae]
MKAAIASRLTGNSGPKILDPSGWVHPVEMPWPDNHEISVKNAAPSGTSEKAPDVVTEGWTSRDVFAEGTLPGWLVAAATEAGMAAFAGIAPAIRNRTANALMRATADRKNPEQDTGGTPTYTRQYQRSPTSHDIGTSRS